MHIYLQKTKKRDGEMVLTDHLGYRGKAAEGDDPVSYAQLMERKGFRVHLSEEYLGRTLDKDLNTLEH